MPVQTLAQKLRIHSGQRLRLVNAPDDFMTLLEPLPDAVKEVARGSAEQWHCFVKNRRQLSQVWPKIWRQLRPGDLVWFYYPKGNSGVQTDLTRDKGWDILDEHIQELQWNNLIALNETWSGTGLRRVEPGGKPATIKPQREELPWIDHVNRTVTLPPSMLAVLKKNPKQAAVFEKMAFTHKREYVEWIMSAKKEETLARRLEQFIEKLKLKS